MPFLLPPGENWSNELGCFLVFYPDEPAFRQALLGAITEFTKWWTWERDPLHRGAIAANLWDDAITATLECIEMGFCDQILAAIQANTDAINALSFDPVCCDMLPGSDTIIAEHEGDLTDSDTDVLNDIVPAGYVDGDDFKDNYLCAAATLYVDSLIELPDRLTSLTSVTIAALTLVILTYTAGAYIAIAGAIFGILTLAHIIEFLSIIEDILDAISTGSEPPGSAASVALSGARDDLICAIYSSSTADIAANQLELVIDNTLSTGWATVLKAWPHETLLAKVFNGDTELPADVGEDCSGCTGALGYVEFGNDGSTYPLRTWWTPIFSSGFNGLGDWVGNRNGEANVLHNEDLDTLLGTTTLNIWKVEVYMRAVSPLTNGGIHVASSGSGNPGPTLPIPTTGVWGWYEPEFAVSHTNGILIAAHMSTEGNMEMRAARVYYTV